MQQENMEEKKAPFWKWVHKLSPVMKGFGIGIAVWLLTGLGNAFWTIFVLVPTIEYNCRKIKKEPEP